MNIYQQKKYLTAAENDYKWGLVVRNVGYSMVEPDYENYPLKGHPQDFDFDINKGRVLDSFQIIYISQGRGKLYFHPHHPISVEAGDLFILKPLQWHSYYPEKNTGWTEYWIGAKGEIIDQKFKHEQFKLSDCIFKIGVRQDIIELYIKALDVAEKEGPFYQQALAGIVNMLFGMALYYNKNISKEGDVTVSRIQQAQAIIREHLNEDICPEHIAAMVNMSYSWFRKNFRDYTNMSPTRYIMELKMQEARNMLLNSSMSIKEIAYSLNYSNIPYFTTLFKRLEGITPSEYRATYRT